MLIQNKNVHIFVLFFANVESYLTLLSDLTAVSYDT